MILIMWLTGGGKKPVTPTKPALPPPPAVTPTDPTKVQDFKQTIQQEQQQAIRQPVPLPQPTGAAATPGVAGNYSPYPSQPGQAEVYPSGQNLGPEGPPYYGQPQQTAQAPQADPIKAEEKKRAYLSLFASNVALTYRKGEAAVKLAGSPTDPTSGMAAPQPDEQAPISQAQALRGAEALAAMGPPLPWTQPPQQAAMPSKPASSDIQQSAKSDAKPVNPDAAQPGEFNSSTGKKYVLFEGTVIETVLMNRLNGSFSGPVNCLVTHDVYSHDRQHVLIPAGTKVLGEAQKVNAFGQQRLAVFFHRLIMPDAYSVNLDRFKGLDQLGATALHDKVNNHYAKIFGASLAVGILGGIGQVGTGPILTQSALDEARIGFGESMAMTGERIIDRFLNLMPTITIREGTRVKVYLSNDLLLPDYNQHKMPADF